MPLRPCALALAFALALQSSPVPGMAAATEVVMGAECGHIRNGTALARDTCPGPGACKVVSAEGEDDVMKCVHKALFPLDSSDITALFLVFVSTALAAGGGIGGGGLLVPIYILVNSFETSQATALSLATISGGSIANLWTYMQRYHPNGKLTRPLIDYDASLLFCPALLAGTMFGSMFSVMFPEWLTVVCLVVLLGYSAHRTLKKGLEKWKKDSARLNAAAETKTTKQTTKTKTDHPDADSKPIAGDAGGDGGDGAELQLVSVSRNEEKSGGGGGDDGDGDGDGRAMLGEDRSDESSEEQKRLKTPLSSSEGSTRIPVTFEEVELDAVADAEAAAEEAETESRPIPLHLLSSTDKQLSKLYLKETTRFPTEKLAATTGLWAVVLIFALLRGGKGGDSLAGVSCGDGGYWGLFFANIVILIGCTLYLRQRTLSVYESKVALGHQDLEGDLAWTKRSTALYPALCVFAGVAAGLLGIGGGMVLGPLLVALGCLPQPIAATSAFVVFITATSGLCQVIIFGLLPLDYAVLFSIVGVFATFFGQSVVDYVVKKYKKDAIVILVIGFIMAVALVLMTFAGVQKVMAGAAIGFTGLC